MKTKREYRAKVTIVMDVRTPEIPGQSHYFIPAGTVIDCTVEDYGIGVVNLILSPNAKPPLLSRIPRLALEIQELN